MPNTQQVNRNIILIINPAKEGGGDDIYLLKLKSNEEDEEGICRGNSEKKIFIGSFF